MAQVNLFIFKKGESKLHKTHPTLKILLMFASSMLITTGSNIVLIYYLLLILLGFYKSKLKLSLLLKDIKYILIIALLIILFQVILSSGNKISILLSSLIYSLRIGEIILLGTIFMGTTEPSEITPGLYKVLRNKKIAENISLTIRLIPTFLIGWKEIEESLNSRGLYLIKNPFRFMSAVSLPLLVETFKKADQISMAMDSRCYSGWSDESINNTKLDVIIISLTLLPSLLLIKRLLL